MAITITLEGDLLAQLEDRAQKQQLSVEQLVIRILAGAMLGPESVTPQDAVARVQATRPNPAYVRPAIANLADLLRAAREDPCFDFEAWKRQWADIEAEMRAITRG
jgi:hypothetical protein